MRKSTKPLQNLQGFCKKLQKIIKTVKNNKNCKKYLARYTCLLYNSKGRRRQGKTDGVSHLLFYTKVCKRSCRWQVLCIPKRVEKTAGGWIAVFGQIVGQGRF